MSDWINAKDSLPCHKQKVLFVTNYNDTVFYGHMIIPAFSRAYFISDEGTLSRTYDISDVYCWQPLHKAPKKGEL